MNIKTFIIIQCMIFYKDELYQTSSYIKLHQDVILEIKYIYVIIYTVSYQRKMNGSISFMFLVLVIIIHVSITSTARIIM